MERLLMYVTVWLKKVNLYNGVSLLKEIMDSPKAETREFELVEE